MALPLVVCLIVMVNGGRCTIDGVRDNTECASMLVDGIYSVRSLQSTLVNWPQDQVILYRFQEVPFDTVDLVLVGNGTFLISLKGMNNTTFLVDVKSSPQIFLIYYGGSICVQSTKPISANLVYNTSQHALKLVNVEIESAVPSSLYEMLNEHYQHEDSGSLLSRIRRGITHYVSLVSSTIIKGTANILDSPQMNFTQERAYSLWGSMKLSFSGTSIGRVSKSVQCHACVFWYRLKTSTESALGISSATSFCDINFVPKELCKVAIQTTHSLGSKYLFDDKEAERAYCNSSCN